MLTRHIFCTPSSIKGLTVLDAVHIPLWGVGIGTPEVDIATKTTAAGSKRLATSATVAVYADVVNTKMVPVTATVTVQLTWQPATISGSDAHSAHGHASQLPSSPPTTAAATTFTTNATVHNVAIAANSTASVALNLTLDGPTCSRASVQCGIALWQVDDPALHTAVVSISASDGSKDGVSERFGVRTVKFNASSLIPGSKVPGGTNGKYTESFQFNGEPMKMLGGCVHHANGPLGSMAIDKADERRVATLKAAGYNAIRTSHNPPSQAFLDAADKHGIMILDEAFDCWAQGKNPDDYHRAFEEWWQRDMTAMVRRDRNHPSVVMWSIGNEIPMRFTKYGTNLSVVLRDYVHAADIPGSGRAVTSAYPMLNDQDSQFLHNLEVPGYNYAGWTENKDVYGEDHARLPDRIMVGTESLPYLSFQQYQNVMSRPYLVGDFIWTAIDYLGETAIGKASSTPLASSAFPWHVSNCGDFDLTMQPKPQSEYRQLLWNSPTNAGKGTPKVMVHQPCAVDEHLTPWGWPDEESSWTWPGHEGEMMQLRIFYNGCATASAKICPAPAASRDIIDNTNHHVGDTTATAKCQAVGGNVSFPPPKDGGNFTAVMTVPYIPGALTVTASDCVGGKDASTTLTTAGTPAKLVLAVERSVIAHSPNDLAFVNVVVVDSHGVRVPNSNRVTVHFNVDGSAAKLIAVGSGDPADPSSFTAAKRISWRGRVQAIIQPVAGSAAGNVTVTASAEGLASGSTTFETVTGN